MTNECSIAELQMAIDGNLPLDREQWLYRHLEHCESCVAAMDELVGGSASCQELASLLVGDALDEAVPSREECSDVDFTVEHLEPSDRPNVLGCLGGYDVLEIIGRGGMGVVLKGYDRELNRYIAIKVLAPHLAQSALAKKRFAREAQAAAAVVHPHVLAIHQVQPNGRLPFLVMPLVAGESLAQRLTTEGRLELKETLRIGMQAAAGLAAAHEQGLVHRDVKPANILLEKGVERAVLTDFGLARAADDVSMTRWGVIAGTPQYMSPEQARGDALDARSDLFSLGCVLYEMASGESPFRTDSTMATLRRLIDDDPVALSSLNAELPPWFVAIVDRLLEKDPARRFGSAKEVSELLEGCLAHVQQPTNVPLPAALASTLSQSTKKPRRPFFWRIAIMLSLLGIGVVVAALVETAPPEIAGHWSGDDWGQLVLTKSSAGECSGTFSETVTKQPGKIQLRWSRIERRFNGTWSEGDERFGELSLRHIDGEIRGAFTTDARSKINPSTPRLADIAWRRIDEVDGMTVKDAQALAQDGWRLWQAGKVVEAEAKFQRAVELAPRDAHSWNGLGWAQFNSGNGAGAAKSFQKAIAIDPKQSGALNGLGHVYLFQRKYRDSEELLLRAATNAPAAWLGLARLYLLTGKFEQAETWAKKVVDSGQGDEIAKKMFEAAKQKRLNEELRSIIEPPREEATDLTPPPTAPALGAKAYKGAIGIYVNALGSVAPPEVAASTPLIHEQAQTMKVFFHVPENHTQTIVRNLDAGKTLNVDVYGNEGNILALGKLVAVDNQIDPTTGTLKCTASVLPNKDVLLYPNQFVNVSLLLETKSGVTLVPLAALRLGPEGPMVYVIDADGIVSERRVTRGVNHRNVTEILSGLSPGEIVVVEPNIKPKAGVKIRYTLVQTPTPEVQHVASPTPREIVAAWLLAWKEGRDRDSWKLCTPKCAVSGVTVELLNLLKADRIKPLHQLGDDSVAFVLCQTVRNENDRQPVLVSELRKVDGQWRIHEGGLENENEAYARMRGFQVNPNVRFEVVAKELMGRWTVNTCGGSMTLNDDGTGTLRTSDPSGEAGEAQDFRWSVKGNTLHLPWPGRPASGAITSFYPDPECFQVSYGDEGNLAVARSHDPDAVIEVNWVLPSKSAKSIHCPMRNRAGETEWHYVEDATLFDDQNVKAAFVVKDADGKSDLKVHFTEDATKKLAELTATNVGKRLAISLEGRLQSVLTIREAITDGTLTISGNFTANEANAFVKKLRPRAISMLEPTISLLAVERHSKGRIEMWRPDGSDLPSNNSIGRFDAGKFESSRPFNHYVFSFLVQNAPKDTLLETFLGDWSGKFGPGASSPVLNGRGFEERPDLEGTLVRLGVLIDPKVSESNAKYGFAIHPKRKLLAWKKGTAWEITERESAFKNISPPIAVKSVTWLAGSQWGLSADKLATQVRIQMPKDIRYQWHWRVVVVDRNGKEHEANPMSPLDLNDMVQDFDLASEDVAEVQLHGRSVEDDFFWAEFKNISLRPANVESNDGAAAKVNSPETKEDGAIKRIGQFDPGMRVGTIASSPDGKLIAVGNGSPSLTMMPSGPSKVNDNWQPVVKIFDTATGEVVTTVKLLDKDEEPIFPGTNTDSYFEVKAIAFSPDASLVAIGTTAGQVKLFEARTGKLVRSLDDAASRKSIAKPTGKRASLTRAMGVVAALDFSPDGKLLAVGGDPFSDDSLAQSDVFESRTPITGPGHLKLWDVTTGVLKHDLVGFSQNVTAVAFSPDGKLLASTGDWLDVGEEGGVAEVGRGVKIWNVSSNKLEGKIQTHDNGFVWSIAFSRDSKTLAIGSQKFGKDKMLGEQSGGTSSGTIRLVYVASGIAEWLQTVPEYGRTVAFSADGKTIVALCGKQSVRFIEATTGSVLREIYPNDKIDRGGWRPLGAASKADRMVFVQVDNDNRQKVEVWDVDAGKVGQAK